MKIPSASKKDIHEKMEYHLLINTASLRSRNNPDGFSLGYYEGIRFTLRALGYEVPEIKIKDNEGIN